MSRPLAAMLRSCRSARGRSCKPSDPCGGRGGPDRGRSRQRLRERRGCGQGGPGGYSCRAEVSEHARELAAAREAWASGEADKLAHQLAAGLKDLETRIGRRHGTRAGAVSAGARSPGRRLPICSSELARLLGNAADVSLSISGPEDLLEALRGRLADQLAGKTVSVDLSAERGARRAHRRRTDRAGDPARGLGGQDRGGAGMKRRGKPRPRSSSSSAAAPAREKEATTAACGRSPTPTS